MVTAGCKIGTLHLKDIVATLKELASAHVTFCGRDNVIPESSADRHRMARHSPEIRSRQISLQIWKEVTARSFRRLSPDPVLCSHGTHNSRNNVRPDVRRVNQMNDRELRGGTGGRRKSHTQGSSHPAAPPWIVNDRHPRCIEATGGTGCSRQFRHIRGPEHDEDFIAPSADEGRNGSRQPRTIMGQHLGHAVSTASPGCEQNPDNLGALRDVLLQWMVPRSTNRSCSEVVACPCLDSHFSRLSIEPSRMTVSAPTVTVTWYLSARRLRSTTPSA
jgi:hypothetical protein